MEFQTGQEVHLQLTQQIRQKVVHTVVRRIAEAYCTVSRALLSNEEGLPDWLLAMRMDYGVGDFRARVRMRLNEEGELTGADDRNPFRLLMTMTLARSARGPLARVAIGPPDFLVTGSLHRLFWEQLIKDDRPLGALRDDIANGVVPPSIREMRAFLRRTGPGAVIFRTNRKGNEDTDILLFRGVVRGREHRLILRAKFRVSQKAGGHEVKIEMGSIKVLHFLPTSFTGSTVEKEAGHYFLRLIAAIQDWMGVIH